MNAPHLVTVDEHGAATLVDGCTCEPFACTVTATAVAAFASVDLLTGPIPAGTYRVTVADDGNVDGWARA